MMFCGKCGNPLQDNAAFCGNCGEPVKQAEEVAAEQSAPVEEETVQPVQETVAEATPAEEVTPAEEAEPVTEIAPKVKKPFNKLWLKIGIPAVALIAVAALVLTNLGLLKGNAVKWFGSDREYLAYVEAGAVSDLSEAAGVLYGSVLSVAPTGETGGAGVTAGGDIKLKFGQLMNTLMSMSGEGDISWLKDISLAFEISSGGSAAGGNYVLKLGDKTVLTFEFVNDTQKGAMYLRVPELSETYLSYPVESPVESFVEMGMFDADMMERLEDALVTYGDKLPSKDTLSALLEKYLLLALENLGEVTSSKQDITVDGVSQNLTVLQVNVTEKNFLEMLHVLLQEAKQDQTIKQIVNDLQALASEWMPNADIDLYAAYTQIVDQWLAYLQEATTDAYTEPVLIWRDLVNGNHEIVGREIVTNNERLFYYALVQNGDNAALEVTAGDLAVKGTGTKKGDVLNMETVLSMEGSELVIVEFKEFNLQKAEGTIRLELSQSAISEMDATSIAMLNPAVEIVCKGEKAFEINVMSGSQMILGLDVSAYQKNGAAAIALPDDSKVVNADDQAALQKWMSSLDVQKLIDSLKAAGVPADLLEGLEDITAGDFGDIFGNYGLGYAEDDGYAYEYDEDFYDDDLTADFDDLMI